MIPNKRDVASAATTCPVEFLLIPPMHFDKSNFFLVIGLQNYEEKIREREKNSLEENFILEKYTSVNKVVLKSQYQLKPTFRYEKCHRTIDDSLPPNLEIRIFSNDLGEYFIQKIDTIRTQLDAEQQTDSLPEDDTPPAVFDEIVLSFPTFMMPSV